MFLFVAFLVFGAALLAAGYFAFTVPQQETEALLAARLRDLRVRGGAGRARASAPDLLRRERRGRLAFLGDFFQWIGLLRRLQEYIYQANLKYRATEVFVLCVILAAGTYFLFELFGMSMAVLRVGLGLLVGFAPVGYILRVRSARLHKFENALPDSIDLFNRSMKAGHNIHAGLETIASEAVEPVKMEFKKVVEELALGSPIEDALHGLGKRIPLIDLKFFITGLILQRQTGANMVQVLENLALLIRERLNLAAKMKAATAQQRFSAGLLCAMPIVVGLGFWVLKPEYIRLLYTDPTGQKFLTYAICSEIVGILVIRKIASPKL
ncbi:MAG: type II secretion system F family protein [Acidobacteria bacterium]|nr:type II secretion system F family protein [Acidobacteriota bacterium]